MSLSRRQFLGTSAAAVVVAGLKAQGQVIGANEKIGVCCVGLHDRGWDHMRAFSAEPD